MFKDSIYTKNNRIYTSGLELIENEKYGDIFVPTKCILIPFKKGKYKDPEYLAWLEMKSPITYKKWVKFIKDNPKKKITRMPIPMTCLSLPEELVPLIDIRSIIFKNMGPAQLVHQALRLKFGHRFYQDVPL